MDKSTLIAYLAGFFDGEGSIFIDKLYGMSCVITSTTKWALESFRFGFGGNITENKKIYNVSQHTTYQWKVKSTKAKIFLQAILPYLKLKKPEAEIAIKFQNRKELKHYTVRNRVPKKEQILREADRILLQKMKEQVKGGINNLWVESIEEKESDQLSLF